MSTHASPAAPGSTIAAESERTPAEVKARLQARVRAAVGEHAARQRGAEPGSWYRHQKAQTAAEHRLHGPGRRK